MIFKSLVKYKKIPNFCSNLPKMKRRISILVSDISNWKD